MRGSLAVKVTQIEISVFGILTLNTVKIDVVCPNNHKQTVRFTEKEFEAEMDSDTLLFHRNTCDINWTPPHHLVEDIRRQFRQ
jgi:hypothetical protein